MPQMRTLFVVDAEGFSRHPDAALPGVHTEIRRVVGRAAEWSGLAETWRNARFVQSTGDGLLAVLPLEAITALVHPFIDRLQDALAGSTPRLRLRVALHVGLVDDEDPVTAGISTATNDVSRLLDCEPLRAALGDSDPDVTFTAAVVSAEVFEKFVRAGRTTLPPSRFRRVRAKVKQFDQPAFLYVPTPSYAERPQEEEVAPAGPAGVSVTGDNAQNVIGVHARDIRQERS